MCVVLTALVNRWTTDGYDYFSVSLTAKLLGKQFGKDTKAIVRSQRAPGA